MAKAESPWIGLGLGCTMVGSSLYGLIFIEEGFMWRGTFVPVWTEWLMLPLGLLITTLAILSIRRGEAKPKPYTDEEIAQAEAELDAMYLRETGEEPKKPEKDQ